MYKNDIGINAGMIWHLLADNGAMTIQEIKKQTEYRESFIFLALGWLARENKINFFQKDDVEYIELSNHPSELYF